jgi:oligopeptidase B
LFLKDFSVFKTNFAERNDKDLWKNVVQGIAGSPITDFDIFRNKLVFIRREEGITGLFVLENDLIRKISFEEELVSVALGFNPDFEPPAFRFSLGSMTTPGRVMEHVFETGENKMLKITPVLGDFKPENYKSERFWATSHDGTKIPVSLVYHKDTPPNGRNPLYLYGYGSYGICLDPYFSIARLSLLNRGFTYAIAHIRGGEEMGYSWYESGKLKHKKNSFEDFIACAKDLAAAGYAAKDKIVAAGGSAGGLLIGAVINQAPETFLGVAAHVPFVDVVTTMLDPTLPLTTFEYGEWGNPNIKQDFEYMLSYSPYDNVEARSYPHILVTAGFHDSQVQYFEPAKWVAKLREVKSDDKLLLLHTNMEAGHWGGSGRFEKLKDTALEYAFFLKILGLHS